MAPRWDLDRAREHDRADELKEVRQRFVLPSGVVYLDGNSLGPLAVGVAERLRHTVAEEWGTVLGPAWGSCGWMEAPERVGDRIAPLIGARPGEVLVADTTSIALAKLVGAALAARPERRVVLSSEDNFPSDLFAIAGAARLAGAELRVVERSGLAGALDGEVALLCLTHVDFRTGELHDVRAMTAAAHAAGSLVLFDLCHSAGAVPVGLEEHGVDLAVGCTYKYLNGGPGSPSFLYVRRELQDVLENPLPGWLGHREPFGFELSFEPAHGIGRFRTSTPPVVALAALDAALDAFEGVTIEQVRAKSSALGQLFIEVVEDAGVDGLEVASPVDPERRGSHVALRHPRSEEIVAGAAAQGVVGDFRAPDLARFGLSPLYLSFEEVYAAAEVVVATARALAA
ncbi:MAG TPA: kynureninase [Acidimicrobiales bacterium]|nr:kynureninase [Acidimicrobiales bacterium]